MVFWFRSPVKDLAPIGGRGVLAKEPGEGNASAGKAKKFASGQCRAMAIRLKTRHRPYQLRTRLRKIK